MEHCEQLFKRGALNQARNQRAGHYFTAKSLNTLLIDQKKVGYTIFSDLFTIWKDFSRYKLVLECLLNY
jgi:hypothetical protein